MYPTPHKSSRNGKKPIGVVLHTMVGTLKGTDAWFANPTSKVSAHYGIGFDGDVHQYVDENEAAWHGGNVSGCTWKFYDGANPNLTTIGIEHEDNKQPNQPRPDALYEASGKLVGEICKRWQIPLDRDHIIGHREIYAKKSCPGTLDLDRIVAIAQGNQAVTPSKPADDVVIQSYKKFIDDLIEVLNPPTDRRGTAELLGEVQRWKSLAQDEQKASKIHQEWLLKVATTLGTQPDPKLILEKLQKLTNQHAAEIKELKSKKLTDYPVSDLCVALVSKLFKRR